MKAEINQRIASLLENPEIESVRVEVRTAFEVYKDAREKDVTTQRAAFDEIEQAPVEPGEEPIRFSYEPDEEDARNDEMYKAFREREKAWREKVAAEQARQPRTENGRFEFHEGIGGQRRAHR